MAKDPTQMTHAERMAALSKDLGSPTAVELGDKLLEMIGHEYQDILAMRERAASRHGIAARPSQIPLLPTQQAPKEAPPSPAPPLLPTQQVSKETHSPAPSSDSHPPIKEMAELVEAYRTHKDSRFLAVRFQTRSNYDYYLRRIAQDCGNSLLAQMDSQYISDLHERWKSGGKGENIYFAHSLVTMLRGLFNFGAVHLKDPQCERLSMVLHRMKFKMNKKKHRRRITGDEVDAIIRKAIEHLVPSVALTQALVFEFGVAQRDVLGEWVPRDEPGESEVFDGAMKWIRGFRWEHIKKGVLHHLAPQGNKPLELDLTKYPRVVQALERVGKKDRGALVVYEKTGLPYHEHQYRQVWREVAAAAGLPENVQNKHSRVRRVAGGTGEADSDGAANAVKDLSEATTRH